MSRWDGAADPPRENRKVALAPLQNAPLTSTNNMWGIIHVLGAAPAVRVRARAPAQARARQERAHKAKARANAPASGILFVSGIFLVYTALVVPARPPTPPETSNQPAPCPPRLARRTRRPPAHRLARPVSPARFRDSRRGRRDRFARGSNDGSVATGPAEAARYPAPLAAGGGGVGRGGR